MQRAQEIQDWYDWLNKWFPREAPSIVVATLGEGEDFKGMRRAELSRFSGAHKKEIGKILDATKEPLETRHVAPGFVKVPLSDGSPVAFASIVSREMEQNSLGALSALDVVYPTADTALRAVMGQYISVQEFAQSIDSLRKPRASADGEDYALLAMRNENAGEIFSTLHILQEAAAGGLDRRAVDEFFQRSQAYQRAGLSVSDDQGLYQQHVTVDEAMDVARNWAKKNPQLLAEMTPPDMMVAAQTLARDMTYPTAGQLSYLEEISGTLRSRLSPDHIPAAESAAALRLLAGESRDRWVGQQLTQAADSVDFLYGRSAQKKGFALSGVCWPDDAFTSGRVTVDLYDPGQGGKVVSVALPGNNGEVAPAIMCPPVWGLEGEGAEESAGSVSSETPERHDDLVSSSSVRAGQKPPRIDM